MPSVRSTSLSSGVGRAVEVEPDGAVRQLAVGLVVDAFEGRAAGHVDRQHPQPPGSGAAPGEARSQRRTHALIRARRQAFRASAAKSSPSPRVRLQGVRRSATGERVARSVGLRGVATSARCRRAPQRIAGPWTACGSDRRNADGTMAFGAQPRPHAAAAVVRYRALGVRNWVSGVAWNPRGRRPDCRKSAALKMNMVNNLKGIAFGPGPANFMARISRFAATRRDQGRNKKSRLFSRLREVR